MICEKCGFDYAGEKCPVCAAENISVVTKTEEKSPCGLIGMIMGIASFVIVGMPLAIAGLILSIIGKKKCSTDGYATAGLITSIISIVLSVLAVVGLVIFYIIYIVFIMGMVGLSSGMMYY